MTLNLCPSVLAPCYNGAHDILRFRPGRRCALKHVVNEIWIHLRPNPWRIIIGNHGSPEPLLVLPLALLAVAPAGRVTVKHRIAWDFIGESLRPRSRIIPPSEPLDDIQHLVLRTTDPHTDVIFQVSRPERWQLHLHVTTTNPAMNRIDLGFHADPDDHWLGFGEHGHPIRPPASFDSWVEEGPVGLGRWSRWLKFTGRVPFPKGPYTSYASLPLWLSSKGYSAWFENRELLRWTLIPRQRQVTAWAPEIHLNLVVGAQPLTVLTRQFTVMGTPPTPPPWVFGPWNDSVRGQDRAVALVEMLRSRRIPSNAVWIEDWMGSWENTQRFWMRPLSHQVDPTLYPDLRSLSERLHRSGFRLLGYFCPEITEGSELYQEALENHLLVRMSDGTPARIDVLGIQHGELDLTHPDATRWFATRCLQPAEALGFDGWMADFGEYLPPQARLSDGSTGWSRHNEWPLLWQKLHREFWDATRPDHDYTFFVRSASLGSHCVAPVLWGGDSDTDFEFADGLPTVVPQVLSAQLAGFFYWSTDIAGYMTFGVTRPATKPLFCRWVELGALLPVMRTHHGTARPRNWTLLGDEETTAIYTRYARLHTALYPFWHHLSRQGGQPLIRALALEFPDDALAWTLDQQFLIGRTLLVAPVVKKSGRRHRVYIPSGSWRYWWSSRVDIGPAWIQLDVPLDQIPIWIRQGQALPLLEGAALTDRPEGIVDSLARISDGPGVGLDQALMAITVYGWGVLENDQTYQLPGRGSLTLHRKEATKKSLESWGRAKYHDHLPYGFSDGGRLWLGPGESVDLQTGYGDFVLTTSEDCPARHYILRWQ